MFRLFLCSIVRKMLCRVPKWSNKVENVKRMTNKEKTQIHNLNTPKHKSTFFVRFVAEGHFFLSLQSYAGKSFSSPMYSVGKTMRRGKKEERTKQKEKSVMTNA